MKKMTANWGLKVASLAFAFLIWFLVNDMDDPEKPITLRDIPISVENADMITRLGKDYAIQDGVDKISWVKIKDRGSIISKLNDKNVKASIDMKEVSNPDSDDSILVTLEVKFTNDKYGELKVVDASTDKVKVRIENVVSRYLRIDTKTSGVLPEGFTIGPIKQEQNTVTLQGPKSEIDNIAAAKVNINVPEIDPNIGVLTLRGLEVELYDKKGGVVESTHIKKNPDTVDLSVEIYKTKSVPIKCNVVGEPADGFLYNGKYEVKPKEIVIAGKPNVISSVKEIVIPSDFDIKGYTKNLETSKSISDALPVGVEFGDKEFSGKVDVVVYIEEEQDRTLDINVRNISISGSVQGYDVRIDENEQDTVALTLQGNSEVLGKLDPSSIKGTVDVTKLVDNDAEEPLKEGIQTAEVQWTLPNGVKVKTPVKVNVDIKNNY
ncbi:MAG: hypothetical protein J5802_09900 [Butyrivibrio sp.]|nr:hypothetical protein [Butyrivibrio sp.]